MGKPEAPSVNYRVRSHSQPAADYRPLVDLGARGRLEAPAWFTATLNPGPIEVTLTLVERTYRITGLRSDAGLDLRALAGATGLMGALAETVANQMILTTTTGDVYSVDHPLEPPVDPLWLVAITYSAAHAVGQPPSKAVAERLGITAGAAAQRVRRARGAGYLPPTSAGKAS
jgi:hypothetical protein